MSQNIIIFIQENIKKLLPIISFIIIWELISQAKIVNQYLFPPPSQVALALVEWYRTFLLTDIYSSSIRLISGLLIGTMFGVIFGIFTGRNDKANTIFSPLIQIFRPLPPVAIIPLIIVWLGIGFTAKIFSIAYAVFFPVWINTHLGASSIPKTYLWSSQLLSKSKVKMIMKVFFPATLSNIIAGIRTGISIGFIMVYVSEIAGASSGIGYRISVSHLAYRIDLMMAALLVLAMMGAFVDYLFSLITNILFPWLKNNYE